jgi:F0F1-type ATP synthase membrane subunit b/b'
MTSQQFPDSNINLNDLLQSYDKLNDALKTNLENISKNTDQNNTNPGQFLQLQMQTSSLAQVGESISNIIANANSVIKNTVQSQRAGA